MSLQGDVRENWMDFEAAWDNYIVATDLCSKLKLANRSNHFFEPNQDGLSIDEYVFQSGAD